MPPLGQKTGQDTATKNNQINKKELPPRYETFRDKIRDLDDKKYITVPASR
jgi:hypothetical protein